MGTHWRLCRHCSKIFILKSDVYVQLCLLGLAILVQLSSVLASSVTRNLQQKKIVYIVYNRNLINTVSHVLSKKICNMFAVSEFWQLVNMWSNVEGTNGDTTLNMFILTFNQNHHLFPRACFAHHQQQHSRVWIGQHQLTLAVKIIHPIISAGKH